MAGGVLGAERPGPAGRPGCHGRQRAAGAGRGPGGRAGGGLATWSRPRHRAGGAASRRVIPERLSVPTWWQVVTLQQHTRVTCSARRPAHPPRSGRCPGHAGTDVSPLPSQRTRKPSSCKWSRCRESARRGRPPGTERRPSPGARLVPAPSAFLLAAENALCGPRRAEEGAPGPRAQQGPPRSHGPHMQALLGSLVQALLRSMGKPRPGCSLPF